QARGQQNSMRRRRGFTWIEILVSIAVIVLAGGIMFATLPISAKSQVSADRYLEASGLVQRKVDQMRSLGYGRLSETELTTAGIAGAKVSTDKYSFTSDDAGLTTFSNGTGTITISDFSSTIKQIQVDFSWKDSGGQATPRSLSVTTLIAKG
ncbi:MAG TPA: prepilin-type N-terminal cleavage/methylation domain-containing protein, partial [Fimbriimonas sp.]|nr:prepilin-type N-terminal cleavage/methylation domain-containing protein [Fimbriimonas sp.]